MARKLKKFNGTPLTDEMYDEMSITNQGMVIVAEKLGLTPSVGQGKNRTTGELFYYIHSTTVEAVVAKINE